MESAVRRLRCSFARDADRVFFRSEVVLGRVAGLGLVVFPAFAGGGRSFFVPRPVQNYSWIGE